MEQLILIVHVLAALAIIGLIMIQQGKGADVGASFGSGASQTVFGSEGSGNVLTKATTMLAILFFATSLGLAWVAKTKVENSGAVDAFIPALVESAEIPDLSAAQSEIPAELEIPESVVPQELEIPAPERK